MSKKKLKIADARRAGVEFSGSLVIEFDTDADLPITIRMEQSSGIYDYRATLDVATWERVAAWVEWQTKDDAFQRQSRL